MQIRSLAEKAGCQVGYTDWKLARTQRATPGRELVLSFLQVMSTSSHLMILAHKFIYAEYALDDLYWCCSYLVMA